MLFVLTPSAVTDPKALATTSLPRRILTLGRSVRPHGWLGRAVWWRMLIEHSLVRYVIALAPFPVAMLIWPDLALPISQAPILMFGIVLWIETSVLSVPTAARRRALIDHDEAARGLDALRACAPDPHRRAPRHRRGPAAPRDRAIGHGAHDAAHPRLGAGRHAGTGRARSRRRGDRDAQGRALR
jgi:hypothetical protein